MEDAQVCRHVIKDMFSCDVSSGEALDLFKEMGLLNPGGAFYRERAKKFFEMTHFALHVIKALNKISRKTKATLLEGGCGRSYLSFFINFLLAKTGARDAYFIGVDQNQGLIDACNRVKEKFGFKNMDFHSTRIIDFQPPKEVGKIHLVFSLHACDTATDETIAKGIQLGSRYILVVPCCQREIVQQLKRFSSSEVNNPFKALIGKSLLREQMGITLTEGLRTLVLEAAGYQVDLFAFISPKYTPKNTIIRAQKTGFRNPHSLQSYNELKKFFNLNPKIEEYLPNLLGEMKE